MDRTKRLAGRLHSANLHRYLIAGGTAFLAEYATFLIFFRLLDGSLYIANSVSFACGLFLSFLLNRQWTFKKNATDFKHAGHHQLALYVTLALINLLLINVIIGVLNALGVDPLFGKIISMMAIVIWNFIIFNKLIFRKAS